jgi:hypothetical protein
VAFRLRKKVWHGAFYDGTTSCADRDILAAIDGEADRRRCNLSTRIEGPDLFAGFGVKRKCVALQIAGKD